ncbi:ABC transporter substrate-binding protein [Kutzneria sp. NPDC052558]|uniref:ABC transporter substrate-binding protein n=1 Tax=Kutzneria sp. NPDC052558 TaxID=3364121 RepID=UPI0037C7A527
MKPLALLVIVAALGLSACGGNASTPSAGVSLTAAPDGPLRLKGVCPDTVVIQTDWSPEAEHGGSYQLLGSGYSVDTARKRVTGKLVTGNVDTGVALEIRAGGPAIGFQTVSSQMYLDQSITLGQVITDEAVLLSATQPTTAVVSPLAVSPQMIMWDPAAHPDWHTIADIGRTDTKVLYYQANTYMQYLTGAGILRKSQVDGSYDGSPAAFVAEGGKIAQQGFATEEPYTYEHTLPQWNKPVAFQLVNDTGYPVYPEALSVRSAQLSALSPCLRKLVPILQRAEVDYLTSPAATNKLISTLASRYSLGRPYTEAEAQFSTQQQLKLHVAGNQPGTRTLGGFDQTRLHRVVDILTPIAAAQGKQLKPGLAPTDLATSDFIDPAVGLP